jgi:hypothetical protein
VWVDLENDVNPPEKVKLERQTLHPPSLVVPWRLSSSSSSNRSSRQLGMSGVLSLHHPRYGSGS